MDPEALAAYTETLRADAERFGVALGEPRFDDDGWDEKLELGDFAEQVAAVLFMFGCPSAAEVIPAAARRASPTSWVTITDLDGGARGGRGGGGRARRAGSRGRRASRDLP